MSVFKACDVRGVYPQELTEQIVFKIGRAIGTIMQYGSIVVGGDVRLSTPGLKTALIDGLVSSSCEVTDIGITATPAFYYSKDMLNCKAGVMVTASHNPPEYNGLKIILGDLPITPEQLNKIKARTDSGSFISMRGHVKSLDITESYISHIMQLTANMFERDIKRPKVVVDCGNGCYSEIAPDVFHRLGFDIVPLFCEPDGTFPNRSPNTAIAANLEALRDEVKAQGADLGVAFDGDGDRVSFVDELGTVISADKATAIIAMHKRNPVGAGDKVVLDIKSSSSISEVVSAMGGVAMMERSGHTFIKTRMIQDEAVLGGEVSGHIFYRELNGGDDGLYSALVMADIVSRFGSISALAGKIADKATTPDIRVKIESPEAMLEAIADAFPKEMISRLDGVRIQFKNGWALARKSVTEPVTTLRFEASDTQGLYEIMNQFLTPAPALLEAVKTAYKQFPG